MISLKTASELEKMRDAGKISAQALLVAGECCKPGVSTWEIDQAVRKFIFSQGAKPNFLNYNGFPAAACISLNDTVIHGIPSKRQILQEGDIVSIDTGAEYRGYHGDNAFTFSVGAISEQAQKLLNITQKALEAGIEQAVAGNRIGDISHAVEQTAAPGGFGILRQYVGHGIGQRMHEDPEVPNYGRAGHGIRLTPGMVLAIEPMITEHGDEVECMEDGWTVKTVNGCLAAHFEHTVAITEKGPVILTKA